MQKTLFGVRAIQTMDGAKHQHRKHFFQSVMTKEYQEQLVEIAEKSGKVLPDAGRVWDRLCFLMK